MSGAPAPAPAPAGARFNPPPSWPVPTGFDPRRGHLADPTWPAPPEGWSFWVADPTVGREGATLPSTRLPRGKLEAGERRRLALVLAGLLVVGVPLVWWAVTSEEPVAEGVGSCWTGDEWAEPVSCDSSEAVYTVEEEVTSPEQCSQSSPGYFEEGGTVLCLRKIG